MEFRTGQVAARARASGSPCPSSGSSWPPGFFVARFAVPDRIDSHESVLMVGVVVAGVLFTRHPLWSLAAVLGTTLLGLNSVSIPAGPFDLRVSDAAPRGSDGLGRHLRLQRGRTPRNDVGQLPLALLLIVFGVSLAFSYGVARADFLHLIVSLMRAVATFSLVWLVPYAVRSAADRVFVLRALVIAGGIELGRTLLDAVQDGIPSRLRGTSGPNAEGLIAVVVLLAVINLPLFKPRYRVLIGILAATCLVLTKSIASIASLMLVLGIFGLRTSTTSDPRKDALLRPTRVLILVVGGLLLIRDGAPAGPRVPDALKNSSTVSRLSYRLCRHPDLPRPPGSGRRLAAKLESRRHRIGGGGRKVKERFSEVAPTCSRRPKSHRPQRLHPGAGGGGPGRSRDPRARAHWWSVGGACGRSSRGPGPESGWPGRRW